MAGSALKTKLESSSYSGSIVSTLPDRLMINGFVCIAAGSSNGRTAVSGTVYLGSSPSPAATEFKYRL